MPSKKDRVLNYSRILISFALLAFIILKNYKNIDEISKVLTGTVSIFIAFALITHLFMLFIESLRWHVLLYAQGEKVSFLTYAFMVPVIFVIIGIPISIGGLGVRENLIVFLLSAVGVQNEKAVVFSLVVLFIHIFNAVLGGIVYLTRNIFFRSKGFI